ncbi:MAG: aspartate aminotransferase family protein [Anaerovoracaceae bacterium]|jgi:acetylornithine/N-succinyldiaminopimelate aminotransferase
MENHVMNTYNRFDIVAESGHGPWIIDDKGNEYLDFISGIAVNCLGHAAPQIAETLAEQASKLIHVSNLMWTQPQIDLANKLAEASGLDKVFFCNSGTEANETALKIARKYGYEKNKGKKTKIICFSNSFHGRTMGALAVTAQEKFREPFRPLIGDVYDAEFNDIDSVKALMDDDVCAVIIELVQGESGVLPADKKFAEDLRALCDEHDALLICDEVQCGMGRSGKLFAYQRYGIMPDIATTAKALGGGMPIGAVMASDKASQYFVPGDHGCTFGGNPLACACGNTIMHELLENGVLDNVNKMSEYFFGRLNALKDKYPDKINLVRGMGLLIGVQMKEGFQAPALEAARKHGLLLAGAGNEVIRFLPPLNVKAEEIDEATARFEAAVKEL